MVKLNDQSPGYYVKPRWDAALEQQITDRIESMRQEVEAALSSANWNEVLAKAGSA